MTVLVVMSGAQINPKALRFIREHGTKPFIFLVDDGDKVIDQYGVRNAAPEHAIENGVPHPTTYILDRDGTVRFKDTRKDFHIWLSESVLRDALAQHN